MNTSPVRFTDLLCLNRKFLVYNLILRNLKLRYRKSYVGIFWTMLIPAANALVYNVVFRYVMKVDIPNYLIFILFGIVPWSFFATSITNGMESLVANQPVLNKVPIPSFTFVLADTLTAFTNFVLAIPVLSLVIVFSEVPLNSYQLFLPVALILLLLQAYGLSLILAYAFVYLRDLRHLMGILLQILFYLTPVLYKTTMVPEQFQFALFLNPIAPIFQFFHVAIGAEPFNIKFIIAPFISTIVILVVSFVVCKKFNQQVVESL